VEHLQRFPDLEIVDQPAAPGYYVAYARAGDTQLIEQVNTAIRALYSSGKLRSIYERYELWNETQTRLPEVWQSWRGGLVSLPTHKLWTLLEQFPLLCRAACVTVALSLLSMPLAVGIGLLLTLVRCWNTRVLGGSPAHATWIWQMLRSLATLYIEVVRGTPLAFQLFVVYFVLPQLGVTISAFWSGVLALAVNYSAYEAEILRLGLQAIPRGQMEAALSLGMTRPLAVRRIILPQAVRIALPATANDFIALFKDTAVCSVIAVEELSKQYSMGAKSTGLFLEMALLASLLYLLMSYPLSRLARWLEQKLNPGHDPQ
jgi:polar amino acid transport system substrate-binding protein